MSEADVSLDTSTGPVSVGSLPAPSLSELSHLVNYIKRAVSILEDDDQAPPVAAAFQASLNDASDSIRKFISDPQVRSLFIQKISNRGITQYSHIQDNIYLDE